MPEQEYAARDETIVEHRDHAFPRFGIEIEEDVPAEDRVATSDEVGALFVEEVHLPEVTQAARCRPDAEAAAGRGHEPLVGHRLRSRSERGGSVDAAARGRDASLREVRSVDAHVPSV